MSHTINGTEVRRSYSLCSAPHEGLLRVGIKAIPNGVFSNYANTELQKGDTLNIGTPEGRFVFTPDGSKNILDGRPIFLDEGHLQKFLDGSKIFFRWI